MYVILGDLWRIKENRSRYYGEAITIYHLQRKSFEFTMKDLW